MIPPKIAPLPPAPVRADAPVDFSTKADAMVGALQPFANQANDLADFVNDRADSANASATSVAGVQSAVSADRVLSQQAASNAAGSAAAALNSANTANSRATAAQQAANASEASAVRAEDAAQYVEGISGGAAPINNPNFQGVVKVNDVPLGTAATRDVGTDSGDVMEVGAGGWLGRAASNSYISGFPATIEESITNVYRRITDDGGVTAYVASIHIAAGNSWGRLRISHISPIAWLQGGYIGGGTPWTAELIHTANILTATGQSTEYPMTQKAVTDAIANIPSVPKSAAYTVTAADKGASIDTTTNVTIPASVFAVGDVIVVTNTSATNSTITPAAGVTFRLAGSASTGARTLAGYGVATLRMVSNNVWFASGAGLS